MSQRITEALLKLSRRLLAIHEMNVASENIVPSSDTSLPSMFNVSESFCCGEYWISD